MITSVHAANQYPMGLKEFSNVAIGGECTEIEVIVANPIGNSYGMSSITFQAPSGWQFCGSDYYSDSEYFYRSFSSSSAISYIFYYSYYTNLQGMPPGASDIFYLDVVGPTSDPSLPPISGTFSTSIIDTSGPAAYMGPTFAMLSIADTSVTVSFTPNNTQYVAGSAPYTVTTALTSGQAGVPISVDAYDYSSSTTYKFTPSTGTSSSTGKLTSTFQPSNHAPDSTRIIGWAGSYDPVTDWGSDIYTVNGTYITTVAGAPASVAFMLGGDPFPATDYLTASGTTVNTAGTPAAAFTGAKIPAGSITFAVADAYGNPVTLGTFSSSTKGTFTAVSGGGLFDNTSLPSSAVYYAANGAIGLDYYQSGNYGTIGLISGTITGSYTALGASSGTSFSVSGSTGNIFTSNFDTTSGTPLVSKTNPTAGKSINVWLAGLQPGLPVTFYVQQLSTSYTYAGTFAGGAQKITLYANSTGFALTSFAVDTLAGATVSFVANEAQPMNDAATHTLGNGTASSVVTTQAGTASQFIIKLYYDAAMTTAVKTSAVNGTSLYVNVGIADAYNNIVGVPPGQQIQVNLASNLGLLSVTSAYITGGNNDTYHSLGPIQLTLPSGVGQAVTLTASGVLNGVFSSATKTVNTVSGLPSLGITSPAPLNGIVYSNSGSVVFLGTANASSGFPSSVTITSVGFSVDGGSWQSAVVAPGNKIVFSVLAVMTDGKHTIAFNATDSNTPGDTAVSSTYTVLVDSVGPSVTITTADGSTLTAGTPLAATIVDPQGDLNATSVAVIANGTALTSATATVTGTNNLGVNTTYTVSITGLPQGTWSVQVSASDLAGNTATSTAITATVFVATNQYFTLSGTPTQTTVGGFPAINAIYVNNLNAAQTGIVFGIVKNSLGQTVYYTTSTISPAAGAQGTAVLVLAGLPHGTYTVNIFVISPTNVAISTSTTVSVTI